MYRDLFFNQLLPFLIYLGVILWGHHKNSDFWMIMGWIGMTWTSIEARISDLEKLIKEKK